MGGKVGDLDGFGLVASAGNVIKLAVMQGGNPIGRAAKVDAVAA